MEATLEPGAVVDERYRLQVLLGRGGFAEVWLATDAIDGGRVALKVGFVGHDEGGARARRWRLDREADVLMTLDHPVIVRARGRGVFGGRPYLVMDYVEGLTLAAELRDRAARGQPYTPRELIARIVPLAEGLGAAHARAVVHRDLKPPNVMVTPAGAVRLLDFGVARLLDVDPVDATTMGRRIGSLLYLSPEQALGRAVDARSDVFALATVAYELACLQQPWTTATPGLDLGAPDRVVRRLVEGPRPQVVRAGASPRLEAALHAAWATAPEARTPDVVTLAAALREALEDEEASTGPGIERAPSGVSALVRAARLPVGGEPEPVQTLARVDAPLARAGRFRAAVAVASGALIVALAGPAARRVGAGFEAVGRASTAEEATAAGGAHAGEAPRDATAGDGALPAPSPSSERQAAPRTSTAPPPSSPIRVASPGVRRAPRARASASAGPGAGPAAPSWRARLAASPERAGEVARQARAELARVPDLGRRRSIEREMETSLFAGDLEALGRALGRLDAELTAGR